MRSAATLLIVTRAASSAFAGETLSMREYEERCASYYARQYDVSPALVRAVIQVESAWQPGVVSSKGAIGLMQREFSATLRSGGGNWAKPGVISGSYWQA